VFAEVMFHVFCRYWRECWFRNQYFSSSRFGISITHKSEAIKKRSYFLQF